MFPGGIGFQELLPILLIIVVIFGAKRIPDIGKGIGEGIQNFKKALKAPVEDDTPQLQEKKAHTKEEASNK